MYKVELREYERGWGQRTECIKTFSSKHEALEFVEEFNSKNTSKTVPDWYMIAIPLFDDETERKQAETKEADNILDF